MDLDIDDILYEGTMEQMQGLHCLCCGPERYRYSESDETLTLTCLDCGTLSKAFKSPRPACVDYFGAEHVFGG